MFRGFSSNSAFVVRFQLTRIVKLVKNRQAGPIMATQRSPHTFHGFRGEGRDIPHTLHEYDIESQVFLLHSCAPSPALKSERITACAKLYAKEPPVQYYIEGTVEEINRA